MGQRHQYVVVYPEKFLNEGNPNNRPEVAEVIHHQWLYGRSAILALDRVLRFARNSWDGTGTDYLFGRETRGYRGGDGTRAIAAAIGVDPDTGYYHRTHLWEPEEWNGAETIKAGPEGGYQYDQLINRPQALAPDMFDNNDGITLIRFKSGERKPGYAFLTPNHIEGDHWSDMVDGRGPWTARDYLEFYYSKSEQSEWPEDLRKAMQEALERIGENGRLMRADEVFSLLPKFRRLAEVAS